MTTESVFGNVECLTAEEQDIWRTVLKSWVFVMDALDRDMAAYGLTLADYEVLVHLSEAHDQQLRMSELAELALMSRSRLTYRVDRLVRKGLVDRRPCETDRRGAFAIITAEGLESLQKASPVHVMGVRQYMLSCIDADGLAAAHEASKAMLAACESTELVDLTTALVAADEDRVRLS